MNAELMWEMFEAKEHDAVYTAWAFGANPDGLAQLVLDGAKRATTSLHYFYEKEDEPLPKVGEYSVILNSTGVAVCIIQTSRIELVPFGSVDEAFAFREGEGDKSLNYWRDVHVDFFNTDLEPLGKKMHDDMLVVLEYFDCVYPLKEV